MNEKELDKQIEELKRLSIGVTSTPAVIVPNDDDEK
jgi:hypothetical protein